MPTQAAVPSFMTGGGLRVDYLITHDGRAAIRQPGGNSLYSAVGAALWGERVGVWARKGQNYQDVWLAQLAQAGIDMSGLVTVPEEMDHRTFFAYTPDGRRDDRNPAAHFSRIAQPLPPDLADYVDSTPGQDDPEAYERLGLRPEEWPEMYTGVTAVHLAGHGLRSHLFIPPLLRKKGVKQLTLDPGERYMIPPLSDFVRQIVRQVDAFLPSEMEIRSLFGEGADYLAAAQMLCSWGAKRVVVKMGAKGVLVVEANGRSTHLPPYHSPGDPRVVDVTGAGDAFCGGFMVGLARSGDAVSAAQMGLVSASIIVEGYGVLYGLTRQPGEIAQRLAAVQSRV
ncbi:MAG: carbohydrate kinase family protein [Chloroflexota bacterium]